MSRDINLLVPKVRDACLMVIEECKKYDTIILITDTLRTLQDQAKLYRQSRLLSEINIKIKKFEDRGFDFLAKILKDVGPQRGKIGVHVTNCGPGESFHNFALAFDAVPIENKVALWDTKKYSLEWNRYGWAVRKSGLSWGGDWDSFKDFPHAQLGEGSSNPLKIYSVDKIKEMLTQNGLI